MQLLHNELSLIQHELLTANAEMLKQNAIKTATENERGIVDLDTLKRTQRNIIETIEETLIIQQHGREERQLAKKLQQLEQDLKSHLVNIKDRINNHKLRIRYNKRKHPTIKLEMLPFYSC